VLEAGSVVDGYRVVWKPLPGMQELALSCPANELLLEGTRGPGKSEIQLAIFRKWVGQGFGSHWRGIIFDRAYKNLDELVIKSKRFFGSLGDGAEWKASNKEYKWVWPTGEELLFRQLRTKDDYQNFHGQEYPYIGWNELTKYPDDSLYEDMLSCNRSSFIPLPGSGVPNIPLRVISTTNPLGVGHNWVKSRFIDRAAPGELQTIWKEVFNPKTQKREPIKRTLCRLFCSYKENIYLTPEYMVFLESIKDENKRRAWLYGDWDITSGGALDDVWSSANVVPRFKIPSTWRVDRSFDWGSSHPFSVGWWAEANGEEIVLPSGSRWAPVKGSLFRIYELYGAEDLEGGANRGLRAPPARVAEEIVVIEKRLKELGWINSFVQPGPADNQIHDVRDANTPTIADEFRKFGIIWGRSDKSNGSRKIGLELTRQMVDNAKTGERPGLYVMQNCKAALKLLPTVPRDEDDLDDVDTDSPDHIYDDTRYRVLSSTFRPGILEIN
jgi:hypothetical protein